MSRSIRPLYQGMLSITRNAVARTTLCRAAVTNVRSLTTESSAQASSLPGAAEAGAISSIPEQASSTAGPSSITRHAQAPTIHVPPAEDPLLHLFTSLIMRDGKRQQASRIISKMLLHIHAFTKAPPLPIVRQAVDMAAPLLRCRSFKRAAKQFVFPMPLTERQRTRQAVDWILQASEAKGGKGAGERVAREIIAVIKGDSAVLKLKSDVHKLAVLHRWVSGTICGVRRGLNVLWTMFLAEEMSYGRQGCPDRTGTRLTPWHDALHVQLKYNAYTRNPVPLTCACTWCCQICIPVRHIPSSIDVMVLFTSSSTLHGVARVQVLDGLRLVCIRVCMKQPTMDVGDG